MSSISSHRHTQVPDPVSLLGGAWARLCPAQSSASATAAAGSAFGAAESMHYLSQRCQKGPKASWPVAAGPEGHLR